VSVDTCMDEGIMSVEVVAVKNPRWST
jgi:hypothetical protein